MELKRVLSLDEFKTLATIKERFKNFVAAGLKKQGKSKSKSKVAGPVSNVRSTSGEDL